jgi:hypothetical protein
VGTRQAYVFNALGGTTLQIQLPVDAPLGPTILTVGASAPFNSTLHSFNRSVLPGITRDCARAKLRIRVSPPFSNAGDHQFPGFAK